MNAKRIPAEGGKVVSAAEMRACDRAAIEDGTSSNALMSRAARALAETVEEFRSGLPVVFFCGNGNNGGDGILAAMLLNDPDIFVLCAEGNRSADCKYCLELFDRAKGLCSQRLGFERSGELPDRYVGVDCLFGTGFHGEIGGEWKPFFELLRNSERVIACDIPSGLNADSGIADPLTVPAEVTVTFAAPKFGQFLADGKDFCGELRIFDIGIPILETAAEIVGSEDVLTLFPPRKNNCHKGSFERVFLIGGSEEYQGAPAIASLAEAAMRSGCGYATLVCPRNLRTLSVLENTFRFCGEDSLVFDEALFQEVCKSADVAVFGMGAGQSAECERILKYLIGNVSGKLILDADALSLLSKHLGWLETAPKHADKTPRIYLTPHPGEFSRLTGIPVREILKNPIGLADGFAERYGVGVLLKGVSSYATDGKNRYLNITGSPALAKAGSGDALCGFSAVPVFRGGTLGLAAGSYLHGASAKLAAKELTEQGVLAGDLGKYLPAVLREIGVR